MERPRWISEVNKRIFTLLNLLILLSIFILPAILLVSAYNIATVASSTKLANPTQSMNNDKITVSSILTAGNQGPFDINAGLTVTVKGNKGTSVAVTGPKVLIAAGSQKQSIPIAVEIDLNTISEDDMRRLAFGSENFTILVSVMASMPPITSLDAEVSAQVRWLPPIYNLTIGTPLVRDARPAKITLEVPISFENQSPFIPVNGDVVIRFYDSTVQQVGEGTISVSAQPNTKWSGSALITTSTHDDSVGFLLNDQILRYRADANFTLKDYHMTLKGLSQNIELDWGAPIKDPQIQTSYTQVNSTHTRVTGTISFLNNNNFLTLDGTITPKLVNAQGKTWAGITQQVHVVPLSATKIGLEIIVPNIELAQASPVGGLRLVLGIETAYGSFDQEVGSIG